MRMLIFICLLSMLFCNVFCDDDRNLKVTLNPGCNETNESNCNYYTLVHVEANSRNSNSDLHYIFEFIGKPSILIARTPKNTSLSVNWSEIMSNSNCLNFSNEPEYVFSSVIKSILLFNDTNDSSSLSDPAVVDITRFDPLSFTWSVMNITELDGKLATLEMNATNINNGSISFKFTAFGFSDHNEDLPHLYHTSNSMQIDILASKIHSNYSSPRIAIELLMISSEESSEGPFQMDRIRNLDDEFTPGIFDVYNIVSPRSKKSSSGGFIQFRPVCYISHDRTVSSSTESRHGNIVDLTNKSNEFDYSLPVNYFNETSMLKNIKQAINITFGMTGDGFYSRTNYISFSFLMGIGHPARESLSPFIITFSSIGLGLPLIVLLVGGTYVAVKKYRN